jgi:hypothetical protein
MLYCRQANCWLIALRLTDVRFDRSGAQGQFRFVTTLRLKGLGCYMVKPHGQLVLVSFIHCCTSTSSLSTL